MTRQIGWYILKEETVFQNRGFECAAWYENIRVPAGRYPIVVHDYELAKDNEVFGHVDSYYVSMQGKVVSDDFGTRFCGTNVGEYDSKQNEGKESVYNFSGYLHQLAIDILHGKDVKELLPEYEAREYSFTSILDGRSVTAYGIFKK